MSDYLKSWVTLMLWIFGIIGVISGGAAWLDKYNCYSQWEASGFEIDWGPAKGCLIKPNGVWIPAENYRDTSR